MAKSKILKNPDRKPRHPPPKYTLTEDEYDIIHRCYRRVVELSDMTDNDEKYHAVNTLLEPIYEDLSMVLEGAQEASGGDSQGSEHPLITKVRDVVKTGDKLHVDALGKLLDGYGLCPDEHPREGGAK